MIRSDIYTKEDVWNIKQYTDCKLPCSMIEWIPMGATQYSNGLDLVSSIRIRNEIDMNECEHFRKANRDRSEIDSN